MSQLIFDLSLTSRTWLSPGRPSKHSGVTRPSFPAMQNYQVLIKSKVCLTSSSDEWIFGNPSLFIWGLLPGISRRLSRRSGRSSAANVLPPSPGTPEVVSLTQDNTVSLRSWNPHCRWRRADNISHTLFAFFMAAFLKLAADHSRSRAGAGKSVSSTDRVKESQCFRLYNSGSGQRSGNICERRQQTDWCAIDCYRFLM